MVDFSNKVTSSNRSKSNLVHNSSKYSTNTDTDKVEYLEEVDVGVIKAVKFSLKRTGITIYHCNVSGPIVYGYFVVVTETFNDYGLPHTLEHLVFMGSNKYPFKGVLDKLANRCFSDGTNAWTDVDHTCYTLETAGYEGFLTVLPVYLDHILYPTLTEEAYLTEVHHINGDGEDAGVVYCEMQAAETNPHNVTQFAFEQKMYPKGCGYRSDTGGRIHEIRSFLNNKMVIDYHNKYYVPSNLSIIVIGTAPKEELLSVLFKYEEEILIKGPIPSIIPRPWTMPIEPLTVNKKTTIKFSTEEDQTGIVKLGWRICAASEIYKSLALGLIGEYLTRTSASPLIKYMVDDNSFANSIMYGIYAQSESVFQLVFEGVETDKLDIVPDICIQIIDKLCIDEDIADNVISKQSGDNFNDLIINEPEDKSEVVKSKVPEDDKISQTSFVQNKNIFLDNLPTLNKSETKIREKHESVEKMDSETLVKDDSISNTKIPFDIDMMISIITNELKSHLNETEESIQSLLSNTCICDLLYCSKKKALGIGMDNISNYEKLKNEDRSFWINLIYTYFSSKNYYVSCSGFPCKDIGEQNDKAEAERIKTRRESIDIVNLGKKLQEANVMHSTPIPPEKIENFISPDPSKISMHPCITSLNFIGNRPHRNEPSIINLSGFKIPIVICDVPTNFCDLGLYFSTRNVPTTYKNYFLLLSQVLMECPIIRNGEEIPYEKVVMDLDQDTVEKGVFIGAGESYPFRYGQTVDLMWIKIKVPLQDYVKGLRWIYELAYQTKITIQRLSAILKRLYLSIPDLNRNGARVNAELVRSILYDKDVIQNLANTCRQREFFQDLFKKIENNPEKVISEINQVRTKIFNFNNAHFHIFTNMKLIHNENIDIINEFNEMFREKLSNLSSNYKISTPIIQPIKSCLIPNKLNSEGVILGIKGIDSSFFSMIYPVEVKTDDFCAVELLFSCLTMLEGPMWCEIRGNGLSYSYALYYLYLSGRIGLHLYRSSQPLKAYQAAKKIIIDYISGNRQFTQEELDAGRNVKVFDYVADTKTVMSIANNALDTKLLPGYFDSTKMLQDIKNITLDDLKRVMNIYLEPMFNLNNIKTVLIANPSKVDELIEDFSKEGIEFSKLASLEKYYLNHDLPELDLPELKLSD